MAAVQSRQDPWLRGVKVDALDPLGPCKELSLQVDVYVSHTELLRTATPMRGL